MESKHYRAILSVEALQEMIRYEILSNIDFYKPSLYIEDTDFIKQLGDYTKHRCYSSDIVDVVLIAASNALRLSINAFVSEQEYYLLYKLRQITPIRTTSIRETNIVHVSGYFDVINFSKLLYII